MSQTVYQVSRDGSTFGSQYNTPAAKSNYGLQMAIFRGELYAILVGATTNLWATKYKSGVGWKDFRYLGDKYKSQGRVSVTALDDRFYVCYRGTNDKIYMLYTEDFATWVDAGAVGSKYTNTQVAPAIQAYGDKVHVIHANKTLYCGACDRDGKFIGSSWEKFENTDTQSALAMTVFRGKLYQFHNGGNTAFYHRVLGPEGKWSSSSVKVAASPITSGVSAVTFKDNKLHVTYRGSGDEVIHRSWDGSTWTDPTPIAGAAMGYQTGLATYVGYLFVSYNKAASSSPSPPPYRYSVPGAMDEKLPFVEETEVDMSVAWAQPQKSAIRKFFCL